MLNVRLIFLLAVTEWQEQSLLIGLSAELLPMQPLRSLAIEQIHLLSCMPCLWLQYCPRID